MTALPGVRTAIADALTTALSGVAVHTWPPATAAPPCVLLIAGNPYLDPGTSWASVTVGLDVRIVVSSSGGPDSAERLDGLIDAAVAALIAADIQVGTIGAPTVDPDSAALYVDIPTSTVWI